MEFALERHGGIGVVTMSSDNGVNALSMSSLEQLSDIVADCEQDDDVVALVVTSSSARCFSAGSDMNDTPTGTDAYPYLSRMLELMSTLERTTLPVVAAVDAKAIAAGFELALSCDWIVAGPMAQFSLTEVTFGMVPGYALTRLPLHLGLGIAKRMMLDPGPYSGSDLERLGLHISTVDDSELVVDTAVATARRLGVGAPASIRVIKRFVPMYPSFEPSINAYNFLFTQPTMSERYRQFLDRRGAE